MDEPGQGVLGRQGELAQVGSFLGSAPGGASALLLEGAAGIGKTTLWHAGVSLARARGHRVLSCRAAESEARLSYAALGDLFDFELPDLPAPQRRALDAALLRAEVEGAPPDQRAVSVASLGCCASWPRPGRWSSRSTTSSGWTRPRPGCWRSWSVVSRMRRPGSWWPCAALRWRPARPGAGRSGAEPAPGARWTVGRGVDDPPPASSNRRGPHASRPAAAAPDLRGQPAVRPRDRQGPHRAGRPAGARRTAPRPGGPAGAAANTAGRAADERRRRAPGRGGRGPPHGGAGRRGVGTTGPGSGRPEAGRGGGRPAAGRRAARFTHPLLGSTVHAMATPRARRTVHRRLAELVADPEERARHLALAAGGPDPEVARALEEAGRHARRGGAPDAPPSCWSWPGG
jgi:hypothetical protein